MFGVEINVSVREVSFPAFLFTECGMGDGFTISPLILRKMVGGGEMNYWPGDRSVASGPPEEASGEKLNPQVGGERRATSRTRIFAPIPLRCALSPLPRGGIWRASCFRIKFLGWQALFR